MNFQSKSSLIWNIADLLRGGWKQHEYQDVILPLTVLKLLDSLLKVLLTPILEKTTRYKYYNVSEYNFDKLLDDQTNIVKNFEHYLHGFSENVEEIIDRFQFEEQMVNFLNSHFELYELLDNQPDLKNTSKTGYLIRSIRKFI